MPATTTARKAAPIATPAWAQTSARLPGRAPKAELPLEIRTIGRYGILDLMRIGAGLSYQEVGRRAGMRPIRAMRLIRGGYSKPPGTALQRVLDVLWAALPVTEQAIPLRVIETGARSKPVPSVPIGEIFYVTLQEAARLLLVKLPKMRRLVSEHPEMGALKIGGNIRIPRRALEEFITNPRCPSVAPAGFVTSAQLAALFRVSPETIAHAIREKCIRAVRSGERDRPRIPLSEVQRLMKQGTAKLRPLKQWAPGNRRHVHPHTISRSR